MATELNNFNTTLTRVNIKDFDSKSESKKPFDAEEATKLWRRIWSTSVKHKIMNGLTKLKKR